MKRKFRFAILGLFFALCCVFVIFGYGFSSIKVNADTGENINAEFNYDFVGKTYILYNEDGTNSVIFKIISNNKLVMTDGENSKEITYLVHSFKNKVLVIDLGGELNYFALNDDNTISEYDITQEGNSDTRTDIDGTLLQIKDIVVLIIAILSSFALTGTSAASILKLVKGTNKEENNTLKASQKQLENIQKQLEEKWDVVSTYVEKIQEVYLLLDKLYNDQEERQKLIKEVVNETLGDNNNESEEKGNTI